MPKALELTDDALAKLPIPHAGQGRESIDSKPRKSNEKPDQMPLQVRLPARR